MISIKEHFVTADIPWFPPCAVRWVCYSDFGAQVNTALATPGLGWHYAGIQLDAAVLHRRTRNGLAPGDSERLGCSIVP